MHESCVPVSAEKIAILRMIWREFVCLKMDAFRQPIQCHHHFHWLCPRKMLSVHRQTAEIIFIVETDSFWRIKRKNELKKEEHKNKMKKIAVTVIERVHFGALYARTHTMNHWTAIRYSLRRKQRRELSHITVVEKKILILHPNLVRDCCGYTLFVAPDKRNWRVTNKKTPI